MTTPTTPTTRPLRAWPPPVPAARRHRPEGPTILADLPTVELPALDDLPTVELPRIVRPATMPQQRTVTAAWPAIR